MKVNGIPTRTIRSIDGGRAVEIIDQTLLPYRFERRTLTDWRVGDSKSYVTDANGEVVQLARDGYCSATLTVEGQGVVGSHGVTIGGTLYAVGQSMSVYFDDCKLFLRVSGIEVME